MEESSIDFEFETDLTVLTDYLTEKKRNDALKLDKQIKNDLEELTPYTIKELDQITRVQEQQASDTLPETDKYSGSNKLSLTQYFERYDFGLDHPKVAEDMDRFILMHSRTKDNKLRKHPVTTFLKLLYRDKALGEEGLKEGSQEYHDFIKDTYNVIALRESSQPFGIVSLENKQIKESRGVQQKTNHTRFLNEKFGDWLAVNGEVTDFDFSSYGAGWNRSITKNVWNIFEADALVGKGRGLNIKTKLKEKRGDLVYALDQKGYILFDRMGEGLQPFALPKNSKEFIVAEFNELVERILVNHERRPTKLNDRALNALLDFSIKDKSW